ncbi:MAG: CIA30 family protein [Aureispira sp.]
MSLPIVSNCTILLTMLYATFTIDFGQTTNNWQIVNDTVMGGRSQSQVQYTNNSVIFTGTVSLENNGGFASFRSPYGQWDLTTYKTLTIRYRSTGFDMAWTMKDQPPYYMPSFKGKLPNSKGKWSTVSFDLRALDAYRLGKPLGYQLSNKELKNIIRMGFISDEKRAGDFELEIDNITFK